MYPRSGFGVRENHKSQLSSARVALRGDFWRKKKSVQGNICQNYPFGNYPCANPRTWAIAPGREFVKLQPPFESIPAHGTVSARTDTALRSLNHHSRGYQTVSIDVLSLLPLQILRPIQPRVFELLGNQTSCEQGSM